MKSLFKYFSAFMGLVILLGSCNHAPANIDKEVSTEEITKINNLAPLTQEEGRSQLTAYCYACHHPKSPSHDEMLAPPLAGIKFKYKQIYPDRDDFIAKMTDFVHQPTKENTAMQGPVRRFGLMPPVALEKDRIREIVAYIYDNKMEIPDWFEEHFEDEHGKPWQL